MRAQATPEVIEALGRLLRVVVNAFGPWGTVLLLLLGATVVFGWRVYEERRKDRTVEKLVEAHSAQALEAQRQAAECREQLMQLLRSERNRGEGDG